MFLKISEGFTTIKQYLILTILLISFIGSFAQVEVNGKYSINPVIDAKGTLAPSSENSWNNYITFLENSKFITEIDLDTRGILYVNGDFNVGKDSLLIINMNGPQLLEKNTNNSSNDENGDDSVFINIRFLNLESKDPLPNILMIINSSSENPVWYRSNELGEVTFKSKKTSFERTVHASNESIEVFRFNIKGSYSYDFQVYLKDKSSTNKLNSDASPEKVIREYKIIKTGKNYFVAKELNGAYFLFEKLK